jgi:hypothetical protein
MIGGVISGWIMGLESILVFNFISFNGQDLFVFLITQFTIFWVKLLQFWLLELVRFHSLFTLLPLFYITRPLDLSRLFYALKHHSHTLIS